MIHDRLIAQEAKNYGLITPYNEELLQPHSYDCTLDNIIKIARYNDRTGERSWEHHNITNGAVYLMHGEFALGSTIEYFKLPSWLVGFVQGKSSVGRNGLQIENAGLIDAEFEGAITLEFYNMAPWPIKLEAGMKICQVHFTKAESPQIKRYKKSGHYNGQKGPTEAVYSL